MGRGQGEGCFGIRGIINLASSVQPSLAPNATSRARQLRREQTSAEQRLWSALRNRQLGGFKFSRQVPIGPYFADFVCRERRLIVEVDGATHGESDEIVRDRWRSDFLLQQGYRLVRVQNIDVYEALSGVCDTILAALAELPGPSP